VTSPTFLLDNSYHAAGTIDGDGEDVWPQRAGSGQSSASASVSSEPLAGGDGAPRGRGGVMVHHMDMYRITEGLDAVPLGLADVFENGIAVVEWPERIAALLPATHLLLRISYLPAHAGTSTPQGMPLSAQPAAWSRSEGVDSDGVDDGAAAGVEEEARRIDAFPRGARSHAWLREVVSALMARGVTGVVGAGPLPHAPASDGGRNKWA